MRTEPCWSTRRYGTHTKREGRVDSCKMETKKQIFDKWRFLSHSRSISPGVCRNKRMSIWTDFKGFVACF